MKAPQELLFGNAPNNAKIRIFGCAAYAHKHATQKTDKLKYREELVVFFGFDAGMYQLYIPRSRDILKTNHASLQETVFSLAKATQSEYVSIDEGSKLDINFCAQGECPNVTLQGSNTRRTFDSNVQMTVPTSKEQQEVERTLENPVTWLHIRIQPKKHVKLW